MSKKKGEKKVPFVHPYLKPLKGPSAEELREDVLKNGGVVKVRDKDGNIQEVKIPGFG